MRVVLLNGQSFEVDMEPVDFWSTYKLVRDGHLEAFVKWHDRSGDHAESVRKTDPDRTFGDLICDSVPDTMPPRAA